jgi:hypothetical protein
MPLHTRPSGRLPASPWKHNRESLTAEGDAHDSKAVEEPVNLSKSGRRRAIKKRFTLSDYWQRARITPAIEKCAADLDSSLIERSSSSNGTRKAISRKYRKVYNYAVFDKPILRL